jgi:hypothetical protein
MTRGSSQLSVGEWRELDSRVDLIKSLPFFQKIAGPYHRSLRGSRSNSGASHDLPPPALSPSSIESSISDPSAVSPRSPGEFDDAFFIELGKAIHLRQFLMGDVIIQEGEVARNMFFVIRGSVEVITADGEIVLAELHAGAFCKFDRAARILADCWS